MKKIIYSFSDTTGFSRRGWNEVAIVTFLDSRDKFVVMTAVMVVGLISKKVGALPGVFRIPYRMEWRTEVNQSFDFDAPVDSLVTMATMFIK